MSAGYTKLFSSILDSTVWNQPAHIKLVWVTMLAMKGHDGVVEASIPGLAKRAGVSVAECEEALQCFLSPDPYSRTKDNDGRRIAEVDGGWEILNHPKYKHKSSPEDVREQTAARMRALRERKRASVTNRHSPSPAVTVTQSDASDAIRSESDKNRREEEQEKKERERESAEREIAAGAAVATKVAKPRSKPPVLLALEAALKAAVGGDAPALSQSLASKACKRVTDYAALEGVSLEEASKRLAESWASGGHSNAWKLCDVPFTAQVVKRAFQGRPERAQATTGKDFADAAPIEEQLARLKGAV